MRRVLAVVILLICHQSGFSYEPTDKYERRELSGYVVLVNPEVLRHADEANPAFTELESQLKNLCSVVRAKPLAELRKIRIWVEWEAKKNGAAEYHVGAGWLKENGYNPDKLNAVEINNARNFVKWSRATQPWMVMHELAHAYHHAVLGADYKPLHEAYQQAKERKLYDSVEKVGGKKQPAYALTNPAEYFAELSEAYFGKNDFFPFTRAELERHDPVGFVLMKKAWGEPLK